MLFSLFWVLFIFFFRFGSPYYLIFFLFSSGFLVSSKSFESFFFSSVFIMLDEVFYFLSSLYSEFELSSIIYETITFNSLPPLQQLIFTHFFFRVKFLFFFTYLLFACLRCSCQFFLPFVLLFKLSIWYVKSHSQCIFISNISYIS